MLACDAYAFAQSSKSIVSDCVEFGCILEEKIEKNLRARPSHMRMRKICFPLSGVPPCCRAPLLSTYSDSAHCAQWYACLPGGVARVSSNSTCAGMLCVCVFVCACAGVKCCVFPTDAFLRDLLCCSDIVHDISTWNSCFGGQQAMFGCFGVPCRGRGVCVCRFSFFEIFRSTLAQIMSRLLHTTMQYVGQVFLTVLDEYSKRLKSRQNRAWHKKRFFWTTLHTLDGLQQKQHQFEALIKSF
jgi:hypothetical protein